MISTDGGIRVVLIFQNISESMLQHRGDDGENVWITHSALAKQVREI